MLFRHAIAASIAILAVSGCSEANQVSVSGLRHRDLGYPPFDGSEVVFHETFMGVAMSKCGRKILLWEGQYTSPPRWCKGRSMAIIILAMPMREEKLSVEPNEFLADGFVSDGTHPYASIHMIGTLDRADAGRRDVLRVECHVRATAVDLRFRPSETGAALEWIHRPPGWSHDPKEGQSDEWSNGVSRMRIAMAANTTYASDVSSILRKHYLRLSDDGDLIIVAGCRGRGVCRSASSGLIAAMRRHPEFILTSETFWTNRD